MKQSFIAFIAVVFILGCVILGKFMFFPSSSESSDFFSFEGQTEEVDCIEFTSEPKGTRSYNGFLHVSGTLKNISDIDVTTVKVTVTFYDASGNKLKSVDTFSEGVLKPQQSWTFEAVSLGRDAESFDYQVYYEVQ